MHNNKKKVVGKLYNLFIPTHMVSQPPFISTQRGNNSSCAGSRTNQKPYTGQIKEIAPYVRTFLCNTIWYKYNASCDAELNPLDFKFYVKHLIF